MRTRRMLSLASACGQGRKLLIFVLVAIALAACGEDSASSPANKTQIQADQSDGQGQDLQQNGQVLANVNGEEITIQDLNAELVRINIPAGSDRKLIAENVLRSVVLRKIFEQRAMTVGMDRTPQMLLELRRTRSALLAQSYLRSRSGDRPTVSRAEAEDYIFDNPAYFANRTYYIFDSIVVPTSEIDEQTKAEFEELGDLNDIESVLLRVDKNHQRRPYTVFSDALPVAMLEQLPDLQRDRKVFFLVQGNSTYITRYQESRPAGLSGEEAIDVAIRRLTDVKTREFLRELEVQSVAESDVIYFGDYSSLNTEPGNLLQDDIQKEIEQTVSSTDSPG